MEACRQGPLEPITKYFPPTSTTTAKKTTSTDRSGDKNSRKKSQVGRPKPNSPNAAPAGPAAVSDGEQFQPSSMESSDEDDEAPAVSSDEEVILEKACGMFTTNLFEQLKRNLRSQKRSEKPSK